MPTQPTPGSYTLDPAGSSVRFRHKTFWGLVTVKGTFATLRGTGTVAADGTGTGTLVIESGTLSTKNPIRDNHLRSKDFFHVKDYPEITFNATKIANTADGAAQVEGELTVRDAKQSLSFPATYEARGDALVLRGEVEVDKTHYGITWNQLGMMGGKTAVELELVFTAAR
jgi:polyisoprenoid-binding protein YceI